MVLGALAIVGCAGSGASSYTCAEIAASTEKAQEVYEEYMRGDEENKLPGTLGSGAVDAGCERVKPEDNALDATKAWFKSPYEPTFGQ